jgi:RimK family alpha-L-glutamate ligase
MRYALVSARSTPTNEALAAVRHEGVRFELMTPAQALRELRAGDVALGRLDVLPTLDGVDDGLWALGALAARGVVVLNEPAALLGAHDKLLTARLLRRRGVSHPPSLHARRGRPLPLVRGPIVVKPRFGSWGRDVVLCSGPGELAATLARLEDRSWYQRHGALVQELVPPQGYDLRVLVVGGAIAGAAYRIARSGEWRTNVALGAVRRPVSTLPPAACTVALAAADATGGDLVGVDLLPDGDGRWIVIEVNGAVEFTSAYAQGSDVFAEVTALLVRAAHARRAAAEPPLRAARA